jgi:type IV pilus biogenesis/stability protein PilW
MSVTALLLVSCVSKARIETANRRLDLGTAYYREGSYEASIEALREAVKADPRNWRAHNQLALAYVARGSRDEAEKSWRRALALDPKEAEILVNYGAYQVQQGHVPEAIGTFELALQDLDYRSPAAVLSNLSYALTQAGRADEAVARAQEAIRRVPRLCQAHFHLGLAYEARKDAEGALAAYRQLMDVCPDGATGARLRTGCILAEAGRGEEAKAPLARVLDEAAGTPLADAARSCLQKAGG